MSKPRQHLTEQEIAALAEGGPAQAVATPAVAEAEIEVSAPAAASDTPVAAAEAAPAPAPAAADAPVAPPPEAKPDLQAVVDFLKTELAAKDTALVEAAVAKKAVEDKLTAMEITHAPMLEITRASVTRMRVALGLASVDLSGMAEVALLAEHKSVSEQFTSKFKVGGVAAVTTEKPTQAASAEVSSLHTARIAAVKPR